MLPFNIFEHNYHPRVYRYSEDVTILQMRDSELDFNHPEGARGASNGRRGESGQEATEEEAMSTVIVTPKRGPGWPVQVLWFIFIGWWAGQIWILLAWALMVTVVGIPLAVKMLNKVPQVLALRGQDANLTVTVVEGVTVLSASEAPQRNLLLRAVYFLLVGWWLSAIWMELAYFACVTIIGLPLGFWMFDRVPALVSLRR